MRKTCNLDHECKGNLFSGVEGGYVCEKAIHDKHLHECSECGRYGEDSVMDYFSKTGNYQCKPGYGCKY